MSKTTDRRLDEATLAARLRAALDARLTTGPMTFGADVAEACLAALEQVTTLTEQMASLTKDVTYAETDAAAHAVPRPIPKQTPWLEQPLWVALMAKHILRARIAALDTLAGAGWQDISTAPMDDVVDLWSSRGFRLTDCIWDVTKYGQIDEPDVWGWTDKNHHGSVEEGGPFTHWRLPPEAPE